MSASTAKFSVMYWLFRDGKPVTRSASRSQVIDAYHKERLNYPLSELRVEKQSLFIEDVLYYPQPQQNQFAALAQ